MNSGEKFDGRYSDSGDEGRWQGSGDGEGAHANQCGLVDRGLKKIVNTFMQKSFSSENYMNNVETNLSANFVPISTPFRKVFTVVVKQAVVARS
jgi:hypothetical protein